jgi:hypothetical protein
VGVGITLSDQGAVDYTAGDVSSSECKLLIGNSSSIKFSKISVSIDPLYTRKCIIPS